MVIDTIRSYLMCA